MVLSNITNQTVQVNAQGPLASRARRDLKQAHPGSKTAGESDDAYIARVTAFQAAITDQLRHGFITNQSAGMLLMECKGELSRYGQPSDMEQRLMTAMTNMKTELKREINDSKAEVLTAMTTQNENESARRHHGWLKLHLANTSGLALHPIKAVKGPNAGQVPPTFPYTPHALRSLTDVQVAGLLSFYQEGQGMTDPKERRMFFSHFLGL